MKILDLRSCISFLEEEKQLVHIKKEVPKDYELAGVGWKFNGESAILFEKIRNYNIPVITGTCWNIKNVSKMFQVQDSFALLNKFSEALAARVKSKTVTDGPVKDVVIKKDIDLLKILPIPWHSRKDAGPYITAGIAISKDIETHVSSQSFHRFEVKGPAKAGICIEPYSHKKTMLDKMEKRNKPLEVAVVIGLDPSIMFSASVTGAEVPHITDKLEIAGALRGEPVKMVKCETIDLEVPADAEIVIEGLVLPKTLEKEGPFAEASGHYGEALERNIFQATAITYRRNTVYQTIIGGSDEHLLLYSLALSASVNRFVKKIDPNILAVYLTHKSCGMHAIVSMKKEEEGQQWNAAMATFVALPTIKHVIVVDEDVDIFNTNDIEWALAMRFQGDKGLTVIREARGEVIDPSSKRGLTTKVAVDATVPLELAKSKERIKYDDIDISKYLSF